MSLLAILISLLLEKLPPPLHGLAVLPGLSLIISGCTHDWPGHKNGQLRTRPARLAKHTV